MTDIQDSPRLVLTLYINGTSARSAAALITLQRLCERELAGQVDLTVVDIHSNPEALSDDRILAVPTLIKRLPPPLRQIVGDLANEERVLAALDLLPMPGPPGEAFPEPEHG
jgi:circadian clock protein KaiB